MLRYFHTGIEQIHISSSSANSIIYFLCDPASKHPNTLNKIDHTTMKGLHKRKIILPINKILLSQIQDKEEPIPVPRKSLVSKFTADKASESHKEILIKSVKFLDYPATLRWSVINRNSSVRWNWVKKPLKLWKRSSAMTECSTGVRREESARSPSPSRSNACKK